MAEVHGHLRDDATYGEKTALKLLEQNLPKEYSVYVETPIQKKRDLRYPDFIVLTNYGVIVLEIKDWVTIEKATPSGATIRTRSGAERHEANPVTSARSFALTLSNTLKERQKQAHDGHEQVPWSCAAVLINLPSSTITQLRVPWGEEFVWGIEDLRNQDVLLKRMRNTFPTERMRSLTRSELEFIRAIIFPIVEIEIPGRPPVILDAEQEKIVTEHPKAKPELTPRQKARLRRIKAQKHLFEELDAEKSIADLPDASKKLSENTAIRLVRGVAGSGKTLVLAQRAKFLAAQYPEWRLAVVSFNEALVSNLRAEFRGFSNVKVLTFHKLCSGLLRSAQINISMTDPDGWVKRHHSNYPQLENLPDSFLTDEIKWIKDVSITSLEQYQVVERRGRGGQARLPKALREVIYQMLQDYNAYLQQQNLCDWADVPHLVLAKLASGEIQYEPYDAILVDEAQDFAPSWIKTVLSVLKPEEGTIFLADDPTQSIYRYYSWREKGIPVAGRTRWLNIPYRNTYEIYSLAFEVVRNDEVLIKSLEEDEWLIEGTLEPDAMRHGPKPVLVKSKTPQDEMQFLRSSIHKLLQDGVPPQNIAVLHRRTRGVAWLNEALRGLGVKIGTFHALKGLEYEAVFLSGLHEMFHDLRDEHEISEERRLFYMVITRARQQLIMTYQGILPRDIRALAPFMDMI